MSGATMTFDDEFNSLDFSKWSPNYSWLPGGGYYSSNETWDVNPNNPATASLNPFSINNGVLTISANPTPGGASSSVGGSPYTSGILTTQGNFSQTYGYFEMRAQFPAGAGFESDFWMLPANGPSTPELDAVELPSAWPTTTTFAIHSSDIGGNGVDGGWANVADSSSGFHTYGVDWEPDKTTWYVDGKQVYQTNTPANLNVPEYMILDLQAGAPGSWPGSPANGASGQLSVDYIRAYSSMPSDANANAAAAAGQGAGANAPSTDSAAINTTTVQANSGTQATSLIAPTTTSGTTTNSSSTSGSQSTTAAVTAQDLSSISGSSPATPTTTSGSATDPSQSSASTGYAATTTTNNAQTYGATGTWHNHYHGG